MPTLSLLLDDSDRKVLHLLLRPLAFLVRVRSVYEVYPCPLEGNEAIYYPVKYTIVPPMMMMIEVKKRRRWLSRKRGL